MTDRATATIKLVVDKREQLGAHYLETVGISIGVENLNLKETIVIDSMALRFQSRHSNRSGSDADPQTTVIHPGGVLKIPPAHLDYCTVQVCPSLLFLKYTNVFDIAVSYRVCTPKIGRRQSLIGEGWFLLVRPAPQLFGRVFISYKEPEDRELANLLFELSTDAGFEAYMAPADLRTGSRIWGEKIPVAIKESKFMFVIWTANTSRGPGVKKEIKIGRENGVALVPLLEKRVADPKHFGRDVEYTRFDVNDAAKTFAAVVQARRGF